MEINEALGALNPANDKHWTREGLPAMKAVEALVGDSSITRQDVTDAWPGFDRDEAAENLAAELEEKANETARVNTNDKMERTVDEDDQDEPEDDDLDEPEAEAAEAIIELPDNFADHVVIIGYDYPAARVELAIKCARKAHPESPIIVQTTKDIDAGEGVSISGLDRYAFLAKSWFNVVNAKAVFMAEREVPKGSQERVVLQLKKQCGR